MTPWMTINSQSGLNRNTLLDSLKQRALQKGWHIASAESCTGGGVAKALTELDGASAWFESGFVCYSNRAKEKLLGVPNTTLASFGAVSQQTVEAMAQGALTKTGAELSVAVSGIAGASGGSLEKPVGTVWFAWHLATGKTYVYSNCLKGDRHAIREQAINIALEGLLLCLDDPQ